MKPRRGRPKKGQELDKHWHAQFISEFIKFDGNNTKAAAACGISRETLWQHRKRFKDFAIAIKSADEQLTDALESAMLKRATQGVLKPVFQKGEHVGDIREYPEATAMFMLKNRRKRYRKVDREESAAKTEAANVNLKVSVKSEKKM